MRIRTSTRNDQHKLWGTGQTPKVKEHTFNNLLNIMLLLSPAKFGSFVVEAEKEKGEGYIAVEIHGVGLGILAQLDGKLERYHRRIIGRHTGPGSHKEVRSRFGR